MPVQMDEYRHGQHADFATEMRECMRDGLCAIPKLVPEGGYWSEKLLAEALVQVAARPGKEGDVRTVRKLIRSWLTGAVCQQKWIVHLRYLYFGEKDSIRQNRFLDSYERSRTISYGNHGSTKRLSYGVPIGSEIDLRKEFFRDFGAYVPERHSKPIPHISYEQFKEWWVETPSGFLCSFRGKEPFAGIGIFPVSVLFADGYLTGKIDEFSLSKKVIQASTGDCFCITGLSSERANADGKPNQTIDVTLPLVIGFALVRWLRDNGDRMGDRLIRFIAEGTTPIGQKLLVKVFQFTPRGVVFDGKATRIRYEREATVEEILDHLSGSRFFQRNETLRAEIASLRAFLTQRIARETAKT